MSFTWKDSILKKNQIFTVFSSVQFENSQKRRLINTFIKYSQCYSIHSEAWNTLHFYSCSHLQRENKQDIIVNKGKEKKTDMDQYYLRQTYLKFVKYKAGVQSKTLEH